MSGTIENLNWRYATKKYDVTKKLTDEQREIITEALRLAPSSFGFQPWKFIHVMSPDVREKLRAAGFHQSPMTDASDLFVLCSLVKIDEAYIDRFLSATAAARNTTVESLASVRNMFLGSVQNRSEQELKDWNARQVYIALGFALAAAAENQIDATPMEGFDPKQFDEILGLAELGVQSRVALAVGFRSPEDESRQFSKVRFPKEDVVVVV